MILERSSWRGGMGEEISIPDALIWIINTFLGLVMHNIKGPKSLDRLSSSR